MGKKRNKVEIFKLEDRVLFEAGAVVQAAEAAAADQANNDGSAAAEMQSDNNQTASDELTSDNLAEMPVPPEMAGSDNADDASAADTAAADPESETVAFTDAPIAASETSERILVVLNSSVADADSIVNDLGDNVEVLRLTSGTDALDTINDYLDEHADTKYSAIHLVSHGSEGYITLNGEKIDSTTINPADWKAIGEHLTDDADILVYGCDTAKSEEGKALVQTIANLTGADVAASIDSTGANGDWDLEYRSGLIEAATINPVSYQYDLAATTITVNSLVDSADDGSADTTTLREAINEANTNGGEYTIVFDQTLAKNVDTNNDGTADVYRIDLTSTLSISKTGLNLTIDGMIGTDRVILDGGDKYDGTTVTDHSGVRIMNISSGTTVAVDGIQFQNGYVSGSGAAINNAGNLTVTNSAFIRNTGSAKGLAVTNTGENAVLVFDSSYIDGTINTASSSYTIGAIASDTGLLVVLNSTIANTQNARGVGHDSATGTVYLINSTLVNNAAGGVRFRNSYAINTIVVSNGGNNDFDSPGGGTSFLYNTIYTKKNADSYTKPVIGNTGGATLQTTFGVEDATLSDDGTLTPVLEAAKGKALQLRIKDTTVETDDGAGNITTSIRKDLQYHNGGTDADEDKNWTTIQAGTKITDEILARMDHDQLGHSRGTKTVGAVSLAEDPSIHTLVVNTTNGADAYDNLTSIEEAVAYANTLEGEQTITFAEGLAFNHDADGNGTADSYLININKTMELTKAGLVLTIDGADKLILDGGDKYDGTTVTTHSGVRIFTVAANTTLNLSNTTLQNGYLLNGNGAAIHNSGTLSITDSTIADNWIDAAKNTSYGVGIYNAASGKLTLTNVNFYDNMGKSTVDETYYVCGGGIANYGTLAITGGVFDGNRSTNNGAAIFNASGATATITGTTFTDNRTTGAAGSGVIFSEGNLTLTQADVTGNYSRYGVVHIGKGSALIDSTLFKANTSNGTSEALYIGGSNSTGSVVVTNSTFFGHTGSGAVGMDTTGSTSNYEATFIGTTFVNNKQAFVANRYNTTSLKLTFINSIVFDSVKVAFAGADIEYINSIYNASGTGTGAPEIKFNNTEDAGIKRSIASTPNQLFGTNTLTLSANGTITPVDAIAKGTALTLKVETTTLDDSTTRQDLKASTDGVTWITIQEGTTLTNEQLANLEHDQIGNSRGTKTIGAVSAAETVQSLVVNTTNGADAYDNLTSIEEAVAYADTLEGEQTITFAEGLAFNHDADGNGTADSYLININKTMELTKAGLVLTIDGADKLILDGGDKYDGTTVTTHSGVQIFTVAADTTLNLSNLTLQNGFYLGKEGGAAILNKGTVTLNDVDVVSNFAQANGGHVHGGAIYNAGTMNIADSYIVDNTGAKFAGSSNWYIYGGAIYNKSGATLNVSGTTFENNEAIWGGGAIENTGTLNVSDSVFNENIGSSDNGAGGAIVSAGGSATLTVSKSTFTGNIGRFGGAISVESGSKAFIVDSYFDGNTAGSRGGGAIYSYHGTFTVMNSTFTNHSSGALGLFTQGTGTASALVINSTFYGNTGDITTNTANETFIVVNSISTSTIKAVSGATIKLFNSIYNATSGTIDVSSGDNTILTGNEVFGSNTVQTDGTIEPVHTAAIGKLAELSINADGDLVYGSTVVQTATAITNEQLANQTHDQLGHSRGTKTIGAVSAKENLTSLVVNTTNGADAYDNLTSIEEAVAYANTLTGTQTVTFAQDLAFNYDADGNGENDSYLINLNKSMTVNNKSGLTLTIDGAIGENKVTLDAGSKFRHFSFSNAVITLQNMTLQNAYAKDTNGGSITSTSTLTIDNVSFLNNELERIAGAYGKGGAIYSNGKLTVRNSEFIGNRAFGENHTVMGGAIYADSAATITNTVFDGNVTRQSGGAIATDNTVNITNSVFRNNKTTSQYGGAIYGGASAYIIVNGSFFEKNQSSRGGAIMLEHGNGIIMNSTFNGNISNEGAVAVFGDNGGHTVIVGSTFTGGQKNDIYLRRNQPTDIINCISTGTLFNYVDAITVNVYNSIYNVSKGGFNGAKNPFAFTNSTQVTDPADIFGSNTVQADGTIMPVLDAALGGAAMLKVVPTQVDETTTRQDLQMSLDGGKTWTTIQEGTRATPEQVTHDQLGHSRGTKTIGAVSAKETASLTVNSTGSAIDAYDGVITLNEAIAYAAADAVAVKGGAASAFAGAGFADNQYTINFADTITQITVDSTIRVDEGAFKTYGLVINGARTDGGKVILDGGATVTFNADGTFASHDKNGVRILHVSKNNNITLNDLIFQNAYSSTADAAAAGVGGAVYFESGGTLRVNDSIFRKNAVYDKGGRGGAAIAAVGGTLLIDNSLFEQNVSIRGASGSAILTVATTTITNSTIRSNYNAGSTGTIMTQGNTLNLINTTITGNYGTDNTAIQSYWTGKTTINLINSTVTGNIASSASAKGVIGYNATPENTYTVLNVINSIVAGNTGGDIALGSRSGSALNVINSVYGTINTTVANTPVNSVVEADPSRIFETVTDGKAVATTQTVNGVMRDVFALKKDGIAAQNGALVGKLSGAYYYMDNGKWFALDGTEQAAFALDAAGYGLGADATIYSTAQNLDNVNTPVDRLYALKAEGAEIIQIGAYAFNFIPNSEAKSLVVNIADDIVSGSDEKTSLREALSYAASLGGTQTITFDSTVFGDGATIVLDSAKGEIELTSNITIDGDVNADGKADVTIDGDNATRIFLINSEIAVNLQNLNLINGNSVDGHGGAILVNNGKASLTVDNILFDGNDAKGTLKNGGAIYAAGGTLVVSDSVFTNNTASASGGALMSNGGSITITNTVFDGNTAGYHGGTIYSIAKLYMNGVTVMNSRGNGMYGAALELQNDSVIANSTFINNSSPHNDSLSTTIDIAKGHVQIFGSTFYTDLVPFANLAAQIAVRDTATLDLVNSVVASVSGTEAFSAADTATLNLYGVKYTGTQAAVAGSTLIADADFGKHFTLVDGKAVIATKTVNGVTHSYLMPLNNTGGATVTLTDSGSDSAPDMITIVPDGASTAVIELVRNDLAADVFTKDQFGRDRGTVKTAGAAIYTVEDPSLVVNTTLDVTNAYDGLTSLREAIAYLNQNGTLNGENTITFAESLSGQTITLASTIGNITKSMTINGDINGDGTADVTVDANQKGHFFDLTTANMEFTINGLILKNSLVSASKTNGGAINLKATGITLNVANSTFSGGSNTQQHGGAIFTNVAGAVLNIENSLFEGNSSKWCGNSVYVTGADVTVNITGSTFRNNTASGGTEASDGGSVYITSAANATVSIRGSLFEGNSSTTKLGGLGISLNNVSGSLIEVVDCDFNNNKTTVGGGAMLVNACTGEVLIQKCDFTGNTAGKDGGALLISSANGEILIDGCTFTNNTATSAGGAIYVSAEKLLTITDSTFTGNTAGTTGGAISTTGLKNLAIENSRFIGNSATSGGGAFYNNCNNAILSFRESLFDANISAKGGAILLQSAWSSGQNYVTMVSLTVINNEATMCGGGILITNQNTTTIADSTIVGNIIRTDNPLGHYSGNTSTWGGAGIFTGSISSPGANNGQRGSLYLMHNLMVDNYMITTGADGTTTAGVKTNSDFYSGQTYQGSGENYLVANVFGAAGKITTYSRAPQAVNYIKIDGVDTNYSGVTGTDIFDASTWDVNGKVLVDSNGLVQLKDLSDNAVLNAAVNRMGYQLGSYASGTRQTYCFSVDGGNTWYTATGTLRTAGAASVYLVDQTDGARVPYSTAGAAQYKPALMWSKADDGTITHWSTIADAKTQLESGSGEYFFAPTMQNFGDVAVNGSLILHGYNTDSELKINLILDSTTDAVTVNGMKFAGEATLTAGSMMIENALLTGEGDLTVTNGVLTILNSTVNSFGGTITIDAANGIGQIVNSTLYGNSGIITGNDKLSILNSLVFGTENLSGYTAKYSVFDGTGTAATNTYSASADDVFGTELVWDGLILTALQVNPASTAPHVNGVYAAMNGTNLYYSNDKVNWKNFSDDSAATVDDAYIIKMDALGNTRVVMNGKAVAGAYSALKEAAGLTVTIATDVVDEYDGYISLREAILYGENGEVALNFDSNGDGTMDSYRITFDVAAISGNTEDGYTMRASADGNILIDLMYNKEGYAGALVISTADKFIIDGENQKIVLDISQGTATRNIYQTAGSLTIRNLALWGTGSNAAGELDLSKDTRILDGSSAGNGGAIIRHTGGSFLAENVLFERGNIGTSGWGGILLPNSDDASSSFIVRDSLFTNNYGQSVFCVHSGNGSAVRRLEGVTFGENNQVTQLTYHHDTGGVVYKDVLIENSHKAAKGFHTTYYTSNTIENLTVRNSSFTEDFIYVDSEGFYIDGVTAYDNTFAKNLYYSKYNRSNIPHHRLGNFTVYNNTFKGNSIFWFTGAGTNFITYDLFNSTIAGNTGTAADLHVINLRPGLAMNLFNSVIVGNKGTSGGYAVYMGDGVTLNAHGNVYDSFFCSDVLTTDTGRVSTLNGVVLTEAATSLGDSNTLSTVKDVFGTEDLSTVWDGKTLAISNDGAAATAGVLVGRIGNNAYYFAKDGVWHKADGTVYQIDDGTGTMVDVALTNDAATNYGLGTKSGTVVYTLGKNSVADSNGVYNVTRVETLEQFNAGSHILNADVYTDPLVVNGTGGAYNRFDGSNSLHEALAYANKTEGAQTITFDNTVFTDTATEYMIDLATTLLVTDAVTISNTTGTKIVLNGGNTVTVNPTTKKATFGEDGIRIMEIAADSATTIDGLIFRNGYEYGDLRNFSDSTQKYGGGGAIFTVSALTVKNSTFEYNNYKSDQDTALTITLGGGAIFAYNTELTIENSSFIGNAMDVQSSWAYIGGSAICALSTDLTISGSSFLDHVSGAGKQSGKFAVVYARNAKGLAITDSTFSGNAMPGVAISGGSGTMTVSGSTFDSNTYGLGGCALQADTSLTIDDCTFSNNVSDNVWGAVLKLGSGAYTVQNCIFTDNINSGASANVGGGAVFLSTNQKGSLTVTDCEFTGNQVTKAAPIGGGAIYANYSGTDGGTINITDSTFTNNSSGTQGGAIYASVATGTVTISGNTFTENTATGNGGAIYLSNTSGTNVLTDNTFTGNSATTGGAVYVVSGETSITGSTFKDNSAVGNGGAIYTAANTTITDSIFGSTTEGEGNSGARGMAIYQAGGAMVITNSSIAGNTSVSTWSDVGAIHANGSSLALYGVQITDNKANGGFSNNNGGGIVVKSGTLTVDLYIDPTTSAETKTTIARNLAGANGGGIYFAANTSGTIKNAVFDSNTGAVQGGGAIYGAAGTTISIENTLFNSNSASGWGSSNGGAINFAGTSLIIKNSLFSGNGATHGWNDGQAPDSGGGAIYVSAGTVDVINSTFYNNLGRVGNGFQVTGGTVNLINSTMYTTGTTSSVEIAGGAVNAINSIVCGTVNGTLNNFRSVVGADAADIFTSTTLTADNTLEIKADSAAAYAGALVGQLDGAYYYAVDGYWYSLDGTKGNALTSDAATGYGLGDTATIYTTAQNTDTNGDPVSRVLTTLAFNAGAHALGTVETPSLVVNVALDAFNPFDGKTTLREAIAYQKADPTLGNTITFSTDVDWNTVGKVITLNSQLSISTAGVVIDGALSYNGTAQGIITIKVPVTYAESLADNTKTVSDFRVFNVSARATLRNMIVKGGLVQDGGGIYASSYLIMENMMVAESGATSNGGGVYIGAGVYAENVTIYNNTLTATTLNSHLAGGGGMFLQGLSYLVNCTITGNTSKNTWVGGGALYTYNHPTYLIGCTVTGNTSANSRYAVATVNQGNPGPSIYIINSIVTGNTGKDVGTFNTNRNNIYFADSIYGTLGANAGDPNVFRKYNSRQITDATQVFGATTELLTDENGIHYIKPIAGPAGFGAKDYQILIFDKSANAMNTCAVVGYFGEDGYFYDMRGQRLLLGWFGTDLRFNNIWATADGENFSYMKETGRGNNLKDRGGVWMYQDYNAAKAKADLSNDELRNLCYITADGLVQAFPEEGSVTLSRLNPAWMKTEGQPASDVFKSLFITDALVDRFGKDRENTLGAVRPDAEIASLVVSTEIDRICKYDGVISLREATGTYAADGDTVTFADALTEVKLDSGLTISKNLTFTDDNMKITGAALTIADAVSLTISSGSMFEITEGIVNNGTLANAGSLTLATLSGTGTLTNSGTLDVNGDFAGGTVNNTGTMILSGANNSVNAGSTLGNVTYDGADGQNVITADTYGNLVISTTGTATVAGDIKATSTTVSTGATLKTEGTFNGGAVNNAGNIDANSDFVVTTLVNTAGQVNLAGTTITVTDLAASTLGNVTYDGATAQQVITGTYAALILSGAGTKTASGNITANSVKNETETEVTGDLAVSGAVESTKSLTVGGNYSATSTTNSSDLKVSGDFSGGAVDNTGAMTLSGASNTGSGSLGNVTYNGAGDQAIIAGTYGKLTISSAGKATANGDITATTTTNSATLDVNGNFAGGAVTNTGSMTLSGATNSGTGTLGDVTYDGTDQQVIAGTYGDLTINSTGKATATGDISAATVDNNANTEVTGNLTTTGDLESAAALKIGGSVDAANITTTGEMEVADNLTATGTVDNDAALTVGGNFSAATTDNSSDLTVSGNYTADTTTTSGTLDVDGNFSGGAVNNTGSMSLAGANNTANAGSTLGDVTYNGTSDQEVIAGTYEDLVISTSGNATATGDISAATVKSDAETAITGNLTATGNITSNGDMDVTGNLTATGDLASTAALTVGGNASANNATLSGETEVTGNLTTTGDLASTAALTVGGDATANNATLSGDTAITGDLTATGTVDSDAALTVGGNLTADTTDNSSDLKVTGNLTANTTNNSGTLDAAGDLDAGALTNSGSISVAGAFATTSTDLGAVEYDGTAAQNVVEGTYSDLSLTGSDKSLAGAVTVTDSLTADANIDTAGQDLTISGAVAGTGTISTTTDSGTVTYDGADQNVLAGAYNNLALANGTKTLNSTASTTVNDTFSATGTTIQSDTADVLASLTVKDAGDDSTPSSAIAGTTFNGIALNNTGSADGYLYVNADTNNADDTTTGVYLVGNVFVAANGIIYGDTLGEVYITVTNGNGDVICEGTADALGWTWAVGNDAIENATTGTAYELVSKEGYKFRFHGDVDVVIGKRAITVKADDLAIDTGDDPVFTYIYIGELVGSDAFTGELASEGDGSQPGDFEITQGTLSLGDNYDLTFIGGTLTVEGGGQDAHQFPNYNNPGNFAGVYDAPVHSTTHSYDHHESVPTLEHQNDRSIGFLFSVSNKQLGDASGAFGDSVPKGADVNIHAHTLSDLLKSYDKSEQIIASPANEIEDAKDDMKDLHDFSNNPFGILPDDEDLHTRAYDESIDFTVIGEDNLSTAKAEQFKDEFDAALEELLTLA